VDRDFHVVADELAVRNLASDSSGNQLSTSGSKFTPILWFVPSADVAVTRSSILSACLPHLRRTLLRSMWHDGANDQPLGGWCTWKNVDKPWDQIRTSRFWKILWQNNFTNTRTTKLVRTASDRMEEFLIAPQYLLAKFPVTFLIEPNRCLFGNDVIHWICPLPNRLSNFLVSACNQGYVSCGTKKEQGI